eukprot:6176319-Pleurochrysis_carterae.AAC.2
MAAFVAEARASRLTKMHALKLSIMHVLELLELIAGSARILLDTDRLAASITCAARGYCMYRRERTSACLRE